MRNLSGPKVKSAETKTQLAARIEKMASAYAAAAGAATGLALLTVPPADAKIVYTPTNQTITTSFQIDLNHDGIPDFDVSFGACCDHGSRLQVILDVQGNLVRELTTAPKEAAALQRGAPIGPKQAFTSFTSGYGGVFMAGGGAYGSYSWSNGPWINTTNRYLGLKFMIDGQPHYGWARLSVTNHNSKIVLSGYAYETEANKALRAGQTSEPAAGANNTSAMLDEFVPQGPSLGMLARGANALDIWRRSPLNTPA